MNFHKSLTLYALTSILITGVFTSAALSQQAITDLSDIANPIKQIKQINPTYPNESEFYTTIDSQQIDRVTAQALQAIEQGELAIARALLQELIITFPNYHLGQLLFAELHAANTSLNSSLNRAHYTQDFMNLLLEASTRLRHSHRFSSHAVTTNAIPNDLLKIGKGLEHWVQVDLEQGTQTVFKVQNGALSKVWEQYVGYGAGGFDKYKEGDLKTPLGIYRIDGYRSDASLPELYGSGALTLDYPNLADRHENRTGSGIWLHGVPRHNRTRGPLSSEGCVIMGNDYINTLHSLVNPSNTLVALSSASAIEQPNIELNELKSAFLQWRTQYIQSAGLSVGFIESSDTSSKAESSEWPVRWKDVTLAISGASSINGEPQNVVMYFQPKNTENSSLERPSFKALFWKRSAPGAQNWVLVGDETHRKET